MEIKPVSPKFVETYAKNTVNDSANYSYTWKYKAALLAFGDSFVDKCTPAKLMVAFEFRFCICHHRSIFSESYFYAVLALHWLYQASLFAL